LQLEKQLIEEERYLDKCKQVWSELFVQLLQF
jgi:hypothetical protein